MRRIAILVALSFSVMLGLTTIVNGTSAQERTPGAGILPEPIHPLIGTWIVNDPTGNPSITSFTSDGIMIDVEFDTSHGLGTWQPTGERTAAFTFIIPIVDEANQFAVTVQIRGEITIDASGNNGTGTFSLVIVQSDGTVLDSEDGTITLTRMPLESMDAKGTPIAGVPTWNPNADNGEGTPEATPTS